MEPQIVTVPPTSPAHTGSVVPFPVRRVVPTPPPPEATEEDLSREIGRRFVAGELVTVCPYCARASMRWKPSKTSRPFGQCSACWTQVHVKTDLAEDGLLAQALDALRREYAQ
jgi:hypothetical protein